MKKHSRTYNAILIFLIIALLGVGVFYFINRGKEDETSLKPLQEAIAKVEKGEVSKIQVDNESQAVILTEKDSGEKTETYGIPNVEGPNGLRELLKEANSQDVKVVSEPITIPKEGILALLLRLVPTLLIIALLVGFAYMSNWGPFNRVKVAPANTDVDFDSVAGCDEAIEELREIEKFLVNPKQFQHLGARTPQGVLLYGPPGTGKTLLAKALASEAKVPFFPVSGSEFIELYAGMGSRRVRQLFEAAKEQAPAIIFIDEIDAIGGKRSLGSSDGAAREADQTLNEILNQMDGFATSKSNPVIVIGATNRIEALDQAIVRPGRFDRQIAVDAPDRNGRLQILEVHSRDKNLSEDVNLEKIAIQTAGMTGADLARLMNESAVHAVRRDATEISAEDIDDAYFRVVAGAKKQHRVLSQEELKRVAYHETGHALVGELIPGANVVHKISIIPRGKSGGQTLYVSEEDVFLHSEQYILDKICSLLAGRAAEEIIFSSVSSGAADDLQKCTSILYQMFALMGMSKSMGLMVRTDETTISEEQAAALDKEIKSVLESEYQRAQKILSENRNKLDMIAQELLKKEVIDREEFLKLINEQANKA